MAWFNWGGDSEKMIFRALGYYSDQAGILRRYKREKQSWENHLNQTKAYILSCALNKDKGKCAVLGSGWLLDIPAVELSELFQEVWLFDVHHPKAVREKMAHLPHVKFVECDISGFAREFYRIAKLKKRDFNDVVPIELKPSFDFNLNEFDFVVSCNLLNQLDIILLDYLKSKKQISPDVEKTLRGRVQDFHLQILPKSKSCLVSDVEEFWITRKKDVVRQFPLVYTSLLPAVCEKSWVWNFDTHYTYVSEYLTAFQVKAYQL